MTNLTQFEASVLEWIASRSEDEALKIQVARARVAERNYTGCGCYTTLAYSTDVPASIAEYSARGPLQGPFIFCPVVEYGADSLLWFVEGRMHQLEIVAFGDYFPEEHSELGNYSLAPAVFNQPKEKQGPQ